MTENLQSFNVRKQFLGKHRRKNNKGQKSVKSLKKFEGKFGENSGKLYDIVIRRKCMKKF